MGPMSRRTLRKAVCRSSTTAPASSADTGGVPDSPFHPDLRRIARFLPRGGIGPRTIGPIRALGRLADRRGRGRAEEHDLGTASVRLHRPTSAAPPTPSPALLWIHGGGLVIGSAAQEDDLCRHLADHLGLPVAAVDYRLAPEHPFPAPLEDCHDALVWLAGRDEVDPTRIAIGGASAGGGLAAALALLARDRGEVAPAFQLLVYPMLDDRSALRTDAEERSFRLWNRKANAFGWRSYTGREPGAEDIDGLAAPARHDDLTRLPPAWIGVGTLDLFHDEDVAYAERLLQAGVDCRLDVVDGAFHGFDRVAARTPVAKAFLATQVEVLAAALTPDPATA